MTLARAEAQCTFIPIIDPHEVVCAYDVTTLDLDSNLSGRMPFVKGEIG